MPGDQKEFDSFHTTRLSIRKFLVANKIVPNEQISVITGLSVNWSTETEIDYDSSSKKVYLSRHGEEGNGKFLELLKVQNL